MNPSAGKTDLPDFESGPFNHLGTSPNLILKFKKNAKNLCCEKTARFNLAENAIANGAKAKCMKRLRKMIVE